MNGSDAFVSIQGPTLAVEIKLSDVTNQSTWTNDADGLEVAKADICAWIQSIAFHRRELDDIAGDSVYGKTVSGTATYGQTINIDLELAEPFYIQGGIARAKGQVGTGDKICCQVVDVNNVLGYGADTVLDEYETDYDVSGFDDVLGKEDIRGHNVKYEDGALLPAGVFLRAICTNTATAGSAKYLVKYFLRRVQ